MASTYTAHTWEARCGPNKCALLRGKGPPFSPLTHKETNYKGVFKSQFASIEKETQVFQMPLQMLEMFSPHAELIGCNHVMLNCKGEGVRKRE